MGLDEPGNHHLAAGMELPAGLFANGWGYLVNTPVPHSDVGQRAFVINASLANDQVQHWRPLPPGSRNADPILLLPFPHLPPCANDLSERECSYGDETGMSGPD